MLDTPSEIALHDTRPSKGARQSVLKSIADNFSELLIVNMTIWVAALAAILSFASLLPPWLPGLPIFAILFGGPAVWATWQTLRLAMSPPTTLPETSRPTDST